VWDLAWPVPTGRRDRRRDAGGPPGWPTAGGLAEGVEPVGQVARGGPVAGGVVAQEAWLPAEAEVAGGSPVSVAVDEQLVGVDELGGGLGVEAGEGGGRRRPLPLEL